MPNYSLVVDATFQPFTYQELAAPIQQATEKHEQLMDKYDELTLTSQQYGRYVGPEGSKSKAMYDKYMSDLTNARDMLNQYGLARSGRSMLSGVRSSYANNMMPLQDAFATRKQEAADQQRAAMADPTIRFSRTALTTDLDYYLDNPNGGYKPVSGKVVQAQVGAAMAALSKRIMTPGSPEQQAAQQVMRPDEFYKAINYGISPDMIPEFYKNDMLRSVVNQVLGGYGMSVGSDGRFHTDGTFDQTVTNDIGNMAVTGLYAGVGQSQLIEDKRAAANLGWEFDQKKMDYQFALNEQSAQNQYARDINKELIKQGKAIDANGNIISVDGGNDSYSPLHTEDLVSQAADPKLRDKAEKDFKEVTDAVTSSGLSVGAGRKITDNGIAYTVNGRRRVVKLYKPDGTLKSQTEYANEVAAGVNDGGLTRSKALQNYGKATTALKKQFGKANTIASIESGFNKKANTYRTQLSQSEQKNGLYINTGMSLDDITSDGLHAGQVSGKTYKGWTVKDDTKLSKLKDAGITHSHVYVSYNQGHEGIVITGDDANGNPVTYFINKNDLNTEQRRFYENSKTANQDVQSANIIRLMTSLGWSAETKATTYNNSLPNSETN